MSFVQRLGREDAERLAMLLAERERRRRGRLFYRMFPDEDTPEPVGPIIDSGMIYARDKYPHHLDFFQAGAKHRERCAMAANRVGKTFGMGGYELTAHLTGEYPDWWQGRRFQHPIRAWAAGKTNETTRDILQSTMLGTVAKVGGAKTVDGTGLIPHDKIGAVSWQSGTSDFVDTVRVAHVSGGSSALGFKSYKQGRGSFEGTAQHVILFDEEPPIDIYGEALIRTATTNGIIMVTFTPLEGITQTVMQFLPKDMRPDTD
jgi:phage terminase large subunit-like protein